MLRIGQIEYANCTPLFHLLKERFPCAGYEFIPGVPAELNRLLASAEIDVCPCSSIEYAHHADRYLILPQLSISSRGAVASVLLFSRCPIEALGGQTILLSSESATSVNLLKILMRQRYGCSCRYEMTHQAITPALQNAPALLLIGDAALRASQSVSKDLQVYDLGLLWYEWTGLPFVFALWLCRRELGQSPLLKTLARTLIQAKDYVPSCYAKLADTVKESGWMGRERLLTYWRDNISYQLDESNLSGLMTFYKKCQQCGLLQRVPELHFTEL